MTRNEGLQQLLLSTGHALLVDTVDGDPSWTCGVDEFELQHLLTKQYINAKTIVDWITERVKPPTTVAYIVVRESKICLKFLQLLIAYLLFQGNKTGLLLMELRAKFAASLSTQNRIPLVSPLSTAAELRTLITSHMICFTAESVFHFLYPAMVRPPNSADLLPSPAHYVAKHATK